MSGPPSHPPRVYAALFLVALVTLALELLCTRIISAVAYYHLSFFVISLAILGMTVGALLVYLRPEIEPAAVLPGATLAFSLSVPAAVLVLFAVPPPPAPTFTGITGLAIGALAISTPFTLSGVIVSLSLTRCSLPFGRIYAADLFGAATGAYVYIVGLDVLPPGALACALGVLGVGASLLYRRAWGDPAVRPVPLAAAVLILTGAVSAFTPLGIDVLYAKHQVVDRSELSFLGWNNHSLVMVGHIERQEPFLWGPSPHAPREPIPMAFLTIDGGAGSAFAASDEGALFSDVTSVAYRLQKPGRVAVIGVGGGRDVQTALLAGATHVDGVEINSLIVDLHQGRIRPEIGALAGIGARSDVTLVHDDARSYIARANQRYDVIQMSLIDTWAASAAGAFALTENGLYTSEAWGGFLDRLTPEGLFTVSRWYVDTGLDETSRALAMAAAVCLERGLAPEDHVLLVASGRVATLVVSRRPLVAEQLDRLREVVADRAFTVLAGPGFPPASPLYGRLLSARTDAELSALYAEAAVDISPATDDRPYFFNQLLPRTLLSGQGSLVGGTSGNLLATLMLLATLLVAGLGLVAGVFGPLAAVGLPAGVGRRPLAASITYFIGIGLGFMLVEMALVQRFSVLLGHPAYALTLVIASMVFATGAGSFAADRLPLSRPVVLGYPLAILAALFATVLALPVAFERSFAGPLELRAAVVLAFTLPCGLLMGLCFPLGMRQVEVFSSRLTPWMWGINGAASVIGTIAAVLSSMTLGIRATLLCGAACYGLVWLANLAFLRERR